jgi:DNA-binding PucR family transcriptional regulator
VAGTSALKSVAVPLCARIDEIAAEISDEIHRLLPQLAAQTALVAETRAAARSTLLQFFAMLREDVDPGGAQLTPELIRLTRAFVHRGVHLPDLLHTVRIGHEIIWNALLDELRRHCDDAVVLADALGLAAQLQFAYVNALSTHAAEEFRVERERWARSADAVRVDVLRAILAREEIDPVRASSRLRYELRRHHLALVLWTDDDPRASGVDDLRRIAREIASVLGCSRPLTIPIGEPLVAAWIAAPPGLSVGAAQAAALEAVDGSVVRVSLGNLDEGVAGFRRTHKEALWARDVAVRATTTGAPVVHYQTVALASIAFAALEQAQNFVTRELGPLAREDKDAPPLAATLSIYLEEGASLDRAARRLGVHRNTVLNRVKRARELMGRGIDERPLELQVALAFARYVGDRESHETSKDGVRHHPVVL